MCRPRASNCVSFSRYVDQSQCDDILAEMHGRRWKDHEHQQMIEFIRQLYSKQPGQNRVYKAAIVLLPDATGLAFALANQSFQSLGMMLNLVFAWVWDLLLQKGFRNRSKECRFQARKRTPSRRNAGNQICGKVLCELPRSVALTPRVNMSLEC